MRSIIRLTEKGDWSEICDFSRTARVDQVLEMTPKRVK